MANLHKLDPHAWQNIKNKQWIDRYIKFRKFIPQSTEQDVET
jgi:hypothetical protein